MRAFQGRQPFSLSPVLATILEQLQVTQPDADAVAELSRLFTTGRESLPIGYLDDPRLAAAYLGYFFPVNLAKIQVLLDELPEQWEQCPDDRPLRVLDLGTGPGTGVMAVLDWLNQYDPLSLRKLTIAAVDASGEALRQGRQLWNAYSSAVDMSGAELLLYAGDLARPKGGWHNEVVRRGPYDLVIMANCLNELFGHTQQSIEDRSACIADLLTLLTPHGTLMLLEPALRETSRALHQVRDRLLAEGRCTIYSPCLHENKCPALPNPDNWCHEERAWQPPSTIQRIDREVGFIKDALKFSYLILRTDGRTIAARSQTTFRMVSELRRLKGDTRAWLCNELGRSEVGRLGKARSATNAAWDECQRGTIVRIEGITRKDGASLGRIPGHAAIHIVRSV